MRSYLRRREGGSGGDEPYVSGRLINWSRNTFETGGDGRGWRGGGGVKTNTQGRRQGKARLILLPLFCAIIERKKKKHRRKFGSLFTTL